jgi:Protein of unknown function (DUF3592)
MAGFVIDIFIGFILRWLVLLWRDVASDKWPTVAGTIVRCHFEKRGYGGDYVVLHYKYKEKFERFQGTIKKPFIYPNYAEAFVRHYPPDSELRVRVHPKDPTRSFPILS